MSAELIALEAPFHLYDLVGTSKGASAAELRKAFHKRSLVLHPDKGGSASAFAELRAAYEVLSDSKLRIAYDRAASRRRMLIRDSACTLLCGTEEPLAVLLYYRFRRDQGVTEDRLWMRACMKGEKGSVLVLELQSKEEPLLSLAMLIAARVFVVIAAPEHREQAAKMFANIGVKVVMVGDQAEEEQLGACVAGLRPQLVDGSLINGRVLAGLLKGYTSSFNEVGEVKHSPLALLQAVDVECQSVRVKCVEVRICMPFIYGRRIVLAHLIPQPPFPLLVADRFTSRKSAS
jgi:hypothetical protein